MIKFTGDMNNRPIAGFGLSEGNLQRLREGKPIHVFGAEMDLPFDVLIFWGETEEKLVEMMKPMLNKHTKIHDQHTIRPKKQ